LLPSAANGAPCGSAACSLRLLALLHAAARFAPSTYRHCSIQWPDLLPSADGADPCGGPACSLRLSVLLHAAAWLATFSCLRLPVLLPTAARLAPSACQRCSLWWPSLLPLSASACSCCSLRQLILHPLHVDTSPCGGPSCSLRLPALLPRRPGLILWPAGAAPCGGLACSLYGSSTPVDVGAAGGGQGCCQPQAVALHTSVDDAAKGWSGLLSLAYVLPAGVELLPTVLRRSLARSLEFV
jgi:hypothetical protein